MKCYNSFTKQLAKKGDELLFKKFFEAFNLVDSSKEENLKEVILIHNLYFEKEIKDIREHVLALYETCLKMNKFIDSYFESVLPKIKSILNEAVISYNQEIGSLIPRKVRTVRELKTTRAMLFLLNERITNMADSYSDYLIDLIYTEADEYFLALLDFLKELIRDNFPKTSKRLLKLINFSFNKGFVDDISPLLDKCIKEDNIQLEITQDKVRVSSYIEENLKPKSIIQTKKIFNYKDMEKYALDQDYEFKWSNGTSHKIFQHRRTNKCVVIPSHELGYGLSCKIQKQIALNSK